MILLCRLWDITPTSGVAGTAEIVLDAVLEDVSSSFTLWLGVYVTYLVRDISVLDFVCKGSMSSGNNSLMVGKRVSKREKVNMAAFSHFTFPDEMAVFYYL